jgi:hypothetical protein
MTYLRSTYNRWLHRGYFERLVRSTLSSTDLIAPETFYALSPSSSCLVYSHKGTIISVAAIDTAHAGEDLDALLGDEEEDKKKKGKAEKSETGLGESVGRTTAREPSMADIVALGGRKQDKSIGLLRHYHTEYGFRPSSPLVVADLRQPYPPHLFSLQPPVHQFPPSHRYPYRSHFARLLPYIFPQVDLRSRFSDRSRQDGSPWIPRLQT